MSHGILVYTLKFLQITPFLHHVKGHQDDTTKYGKLLLEAQLKCDANHEAGSSYYHLHQTKKVVNNVRMMHSRQQSPANNQGQDNYLKLSPNDMNGNHDTGTLGTNTEAQ